MHNASKAFPALSSAWFSAVAPTLLSLLLIIGLIGSSGCGDDVVSDPKQVNFPDSNVSYAQHVRPVLELACNGCHSESNSNNGNVSLATWADVRSIRVINSVHDTNSNLVRVVYNFAFGHPPVTSLFENQRAGIKRWVVEGAKNN